MDEPHTVTAVLPNGVELLVETAGAGGAADIGALDRLELDAVQGALTGLATMVKDALSHVKPDSATVEFGLDITLESGKLTGLLASGKGGASLKVTLGWGDAMVPGM